MSTTKSARLSLLEHTGIKFRVANSLGTKIRYTVFDSVWPQCFVERHSETKAWLTGLVLVDFQVINNVLNTRRLPA